MIKHDDPEKCYYKIILNEENKDKLKNVPEEKIVKEEDYSYVKQELKQSCFSFLKERIIAYAKKDLFDSAETDESKRIILIPADLREFALDQLSAWSHTISLVIWGFYKEDVDYVLAGKPGTEELQYAIPLDKGNGEFQYDVHWMNGLHQALQIYHGLVISTESTISKRMPFYRYFKEGSAIYGLTGTLGKSGIMDFSRIVTEKN